MGVVLVVEDDPLVAAVLCRALRKRVEVLVATTAAEAIRVIRTDELIRIALVDIGLPDTNGLDLTAQIRDARRELPIAIVSAHLNAQLVNRAFALRAYYMVKPFSPEELQQLVDWICEIDSLAPSPLMLAERFALTPRESELLALSLGGYRRDVIRARLGIRESTVKKTVARLLRKFDASSLREIAEVIERDEIEP